jgi:DNA replication protein DnaC
MGWLYAARNGEVIFDSGKAKLVRCECQTHQDQDKRRRYLEGIDGLTPRERSFAFTELKVTPVNDAIIEAVQTATERRRGMITLHGAPGRGKTTLLLCAVNEARRMNVPACYIPMSELLEHLRKAYDPDANVSFDARWDLLSRVEVLAIDELDEFNTTAWAMEKFLRLIDERWRTLDHALTLFALNADLSRLPEKVESRLQDARCQVYRLQGADMRQYLDG